VQDGELAGRRVYSVDGSATCSKAAVQDVATESIRTVEFVVFEQDRLGIKSVPRTREMMQNGVVAERIKFEDHAPAKIAAGLRDSENRARIVDRNELGMIAVNFATRRGNRTA